MITPPDHAQLAPDADLATPADVRAYVERVGLPQAARDLGCSGDSIARFISGLPTRRATGIALRRAVAARTRTRT